MSTPSGPVAHNTESGVSADVFVPWIIQDPDNFPFAPGEREASWHEASDEELAAYEAYWDGQDAEEPEEAPRPFDNTMMLPTSSRTAGF